MSNNVINSFFKDTFLSKIISLPIWCSFCTVKIDDTAENQDDIAFGFDEDEEDDDDELT